MVVPMECKDCLGKGTVEGLFTKWECKTCGGTGTIKLTGTSHHVHPLAPYPELPYGLMHSHMYWNGDSKSPVDMLTGSLMPSGVLYSTRSWNELLVGVVFACSDVVKMLSPRHEPSSFLVTSRAIVETVLQYTSTFIPNKHYWTRLLVGPYVDGAVRAGILEDPITSRELTVLYHDRFPSGKILLGRSGDRDYNGDIGLPYDDSFGIVTVHNV